MSIRAARKRLSLTQVRVAELIGTRQANVSAYETGRLVPGRAVGSRTSALAELPDDTVYRQLWPGTRASTAMQLRKDIRSAVSDGDKLRVIMQASDDFGRLTSPLEYALSFAEPGHSGDRRLDALLAGLAVQLCRNAGLLTTPAWTRAPGRLLDEILWPDSSAPGL